MIQLEFVGLRTPGAPEDRDQIILKVTYLGVTYDWCIYQTPGVDIAASMQAAEATIQSQIDQILAVGGIVQPPVPDYYALRRSEYPSLGDQLDAFWKGTESEAYASMLAKIEAVKQKYPKGYMNIQLPQTNNPLGIIP